MSDYQLHALIVVLSQVAEALGKIAFAILAYAIVRATKD